MIFKFIFQFIKMFTKALLYASKAHEGQIRKYYNLPYITHCIGVVTNLRRVGMYDEDILSASLLHDTVEDCDITYEDLANNFSKRIANLVLEVTNDKKEIERVGKLKYTEWLIDATELSK